MYRFFTKECMVTCLAGKADLNPNETFIWNNKHTKINNKTLFFPAWYHKRIYKIKDLISDSGKFLPFDVFCRMFMLKLVLQHTMVYVIQSVKIGMLSPKNSKAF